MDRCLPPGLWRSPARSLGGSQGGQNCPRGCLRGVGTEFQHNKTEVCISSSKGMVENVSHQVSGAAGGPHYPWLGGSGAEARALSESLGMHIRPVLTEQQGDCSWEGLQPSDRAISESTMGLRLVGLLLGFWDCGKEGLELGHKPLQCPQPRSGCLLCETCVVVTLPRSLCVWCW